MRFFFVKYLFKFSKSTNNESQNKIFQEMDCDRPCATPRALILRLLNVSRIEPYVKS